MQKTRMCMSIRRNKNGPVFPLGVGGEKCHLDQQSKRRRTTCRHREAVARDDKSGRRGGGFLKKLAQII